jgi:5-formyltetrahydrofolate cyclo-ligase
MGRRLRESGRVGVMIGFAHDFQIVERCPSDERDVAVDLIVTERRVLAPGHAE